MHQFFGNVLLIDYWTHLWLIEGFTSLLEYPLAGLLNPTWRDVDFYNIQRLQFVFKDDEVNTAPAMTEVVVNIEEIESNFGPIAYYKAGSVLRMFQHAIGEEIFNGGLRHYLKSNQNKVVLPTDFYHSMEDVLAQNSFIDFNFTESFKSWELQKGFPVIHVKYNNAQRQFHVTQKRYFASSNDKDEANSSWTVPLNFATSRNPIFSTQITHYFEQKTDEKIIPSGDEPGWFVFNLMQIGYYRVNYDFDNWHNLIVLLNSEDYQLINVLNRAQLVDDAMSFAQAGLIDYSVATGVLMYLRHETDYIPWASASVYLNDVYELFGGRNNDLNVSKFENLTKPAK